MCFHISTHHETKLIETQFKAKLSDVRLRPLFDSPHYHLNGFSHPNVLVIPQEKPTVIAPAVWGIVPNNKTPKDIKPYYKEAVKYGGGLNARSEKLFNHFIYQDSILSKRCIVPVSGFFEPHEYKKKKYPYYIKHKENKVLALAGVYTLIGTYITCTILTKDASPLFEQIHNLKKRQPVILSADSAINWLSNDLKKLDLEHIISQSFNDNNLDTYTVNLDLFRPKVNSDVKSIIERYNYEALIA